ncbi:MAG: serine/threonine protein kinase [Verrucomicrobia bacterium]|nr:serine/threonine protein kinase [Verrucomicrobiota bacterium]
MQIPGRAALLVAFILVSPSGVFAEDWPGWRGPRGDGSSSEKTVPVKWSATENIAWKTPITGGGHASPIVWGDRVFTVTAVAETEGRDLVCLDRKSGRVIWQKTVITSPFERKHKLNSHASSTPATDGKLVYVAFLDVRDMVVAAYDFEGNPKWLVRPGAFSSVHGFCSSPVIYKDKLIVNGDHDGASYIVALDRATGATAWKTPRANKTRSYCVPIIRELSGRTQMILSGDKSVASYNPDTGKLHWILDGPTEQWVASIVYNPRADLLFVTGGFPDHHIFGLRHNGSGLIGEKEFAWHHTRPSWVSYVPSPISEGDYFLIVSDQGYACCFNAKTGELKWDQKLGAHHASLVSANGLVYFIADNGVTTVVKPGPAYEAVATNPLGAQVFASPAISNGQIFIRGDKHLFAIGKK